MARTNYSYQKRQKELKRQKKREEKLQRKLAKKSGVDAEADPAAEAGDEDAADIDAAGSAQPPTAAEDID